VIQFISIYHEKVRKTRSQSHCSIFILYLHTPGIHSGKVAMPSDDFFEGLHFPEKRDEHFLLVLFFWYVFSHYSNAWSPGSSGKAEVFGEVQRRIRSSAITSVLKYFRSSCSHVLVLSLQETWTGFHLSMNFSAISAKYPQATMAVNSASSFSVPLASFHLRLVAIVNVATLVPEAVSFISGAAVMFPTIRTSLSDFMVVFSGYW
jgi:hypothetical protein